MATHDLPLGLGQPDASGLVYPAILDNVIGMTNPKRTPCMVFGIPAAADISTELGFRIPQTYVDTPVLVIDGFVHTNEAQTLALGVQTEASSIASDETGDVAYGTEDVITQAMTGIADEDYLVQTISLTPATGYTAGEWINLKFFRDESADTCTTILYCVTGLYFRFNDA